MLRRELLERGTELDWHPPYMQVRFDDWVSGLNGDWLVSRQRFFGVPVPVWYPVGPDGEADHTSPIVPDESILPVDPTTDVPAGYSPEQRGVPGGFSGDPDVMDTWATSSVTPQIACGWEDDPALFAATFPMDLRPQGPEIIRTWLFSTLLRSHQEHGVLPWKHTTINGWILDKDRKKMSKSKNNVITPMAILKDVGSDAVRYWACNGRPGTDTALDMGVMKIGRRLAIKILNASKFALGRLGEGPIPGVDAVHVPLDAALLARLATLVDAATAAHDEFDYARALEVTETFFWSFCDDYVELVKTRAYGEGTAGGTDSARATLALALSVLHRLFAPFLPFVTEEVWSWWQDGSVHLASWPEATDGGGACRCRPSVLRWRPKSSAPCGARRPPTSAPCGRGWRSSPSAVRPRRWPRSRPPGATSSTPAAWTSWWCPPETNCQCRWSWPRSPDPMLREADRAASAISAGVPSWAMRPCRMWRQWLVTTRELAPRQKRFWRGPRPGHRRLAGGPSPLEEICHGRGGGLAAQGGQDVERMLGQGQLGIGHGSLGHRAQPLHEQARRLHGHERVVDPLQHEERRRLGTHPVRRRGIPEELGVLRFFRLHDAPLQHFEQTGAEDGRAVGRARQIHDAVEGDAGLDRRVDVLEARLEVGIAGTQGEECA